MNKIIKLANIIRSLGLRWESNQIISLSSKLKRLQLAERSELTESPNPRDIDSTDAWMMTVAHDLSEILGLHHPAFIGFSGVRGRFASGAYAFSASNDSGESVVLKIGLAVEIRPYQKIMDLFGDNPPSIIPRIYAAGYFEDIGYKPPVKLANDFGYIVMEELESMPSNMAHFLQEFGSEGESLRVLKDYGTLLLDLVNGSIDSIDELLERCLTKEKDGSPKEEILDKKLDLLNKLKEICFFKIKSLNSLGYNNLDKDGKDIYDIFQDIFDKVLGEDLKKGDIEDLSLRAARALLSEVNLTPVNSSYNLNTPLGKHFKEARRELDDFGIDPRDLHADNIMLRPGTGEIVICDLGHFGFGLM